MGPPEKLQTRPIDPPSACLGAFNGATEEVREVLRQIRQKLSRKATGECRKRISNTFSIPPAAISKSSRKRNELYVTLLESLLRSWERVETTASELIGQLRGLEATSSWRDGPSWSSDIVVSLQRLAQTAELGRAMTEFLGSFPVPVRESSRPDVSGWASRLRSWMALGIRQGKRTRVRYHIDWPSTPFSYLEGGFLEVAGWAFEGEGKAAEAVWVEWEGKRWYCRRRFRPDVGAVYPEVKETPSCGFEVSFLVKPGLHRLELKARWSKGKVLQLGVFWVYSMGPDSL